MRLTQQTITDIGILVLGVITAIILVYSQLSRPPQVPVPSLPASVQALIDESNDPVALVKGGKALAAKGDLLAAAASFKKATFLDPHWRDAFIVLGQVYRGLAEQNYPVSPGDLTWWQKAEFALSRARKLDPLYKPTYDELRLIYERTGNRQKLHELTATLNSLHNLD